MLLIMLFSFLSVGSSAANLQTGDVMTGTKWDARVNEGYSDSLVFKSGHRVRQYSCEAGEWYNGSYTLNKDTVIVSWVTESEDGGGKERWRNWYLRRRGLLKPIRGQSYSHGRWEKPTPSTTPADYVFKQVR